MAITAAMVKELREMTGAGMMDCKKALTKTEGDMDAAVEFLRENGLAKAAKKAGRIAAEGLVAVALSDDAKEAAIVEVNSETDFVAKNDTFKAYVAEVADQALTTAAADIEGFLAEDSKAEAGKTVKERIEVSRPSLVEDQTAILPCLYQFLILPVIQEFISINCLRQQHLFDIHTLFFSISIYQFILFFSYPSIL